MSINIKKPEFTITREIDGKPTVIQLTPAEIHALYADLQLLYFYNQTVYYAEDCCELTVIPDEPLWWEIANELLERSYRDEDEVLHQRIFDVLECHGLLDED